MKIAARAISALAHVITGDALPKSKKPISPYLSGPKLVEFFNEFGGNDQYGQGFPSRWKFAEDKLREHNDSETLAAIITEALFSARFLDSEFSADVCAGHVNQYLRFDGFEVKLVGDKYVVRNLLGDVIRVVNPFKEDKLSHQFIAEQIDKADSKIASGDYSGAITNARSLVEAVLVELESRLIAVPPSYDGDLSKLYKRVQKLLQLDPSRTDIAESLRMVLSGLSSIVAGLAPMRNRMSDAHASNYRPAKRHAKLAVNVAKTLTDFLHETFEFQNGRKIVSAKSK